MSRTAMVTAPQPEAAEAGIDILRGGGNAVDAAVATAMVQGVIDPLMCSVAGFGSAAVHTPDDQRTRYLDFHAPAPLAARENMWADIVVGEARDGFGFIVEGNVNEMGYQSPCVPAALRGLHELHARCGSLPWSEVLAPAIDWAERGWPVRPNVVGFWSYPSYMGHAGNPERLAFTPAGRRLHCRPDGRPKRLGDSVENPDLAALLRHIATDGVDDFYEGEIARAIVNDLAAHGGLLTLEDLSTYRPRWSEPLWGTYRGHRVATNQLPGGGAMLLLMLNALERLAPAGLGHNTTDYIELVAEVMRRATVDKDRYLADPRFLDVPLERLLSDDHAEEIAAAVRSGERIDVPRLGSPGEGVDTTTLSVVDGNGGCVALTHSLGLPSGVVAEGMGFMHNGCMGVFDPRPGRPHSIAPGKARFSSIMPTIVFQGDRPYLVIGAPGGTQIAMGVLQVVLNVLDFGCTMEEAILRPRFSATSNSIDVVNRIPHRITDELERRGHTVVRNPMSYGIAMVHGIRIGADGALDGAADPIADGVALAVDVDN